MNWKATLNGSWQQIKNSPRLQKILLIGVISLALLTGTGYWFYSQRYISTEDAYLNANTIEVAARVTGQVAHLYVDNNQWVKSGQLLFELDPTPFLVAVEKAKAQLAINEAAWRNAQLAATRTVDLVKKKALSAQDGDNAIANLQSAVASVQLAKANLAQAELDLRYTRVYAATGGLVTNMTLRESNMVTANQAIFALIDNSHYWVDANFKETDLEDIRPGQVADVAVDMYPGHVFKGIVESVSGGSGTAFALLPPQNATGNWVKVTQRVPVKVRILKLEASYPLRIGTTATVTVNKQRVSSKNLA